ncbi:MAG: OsmC family peroxiredoxin, partial [Sphingobacterium sp.]
MKRNATAVWKGSIKEGSGKLTTDSSTLKDTQYSFKSRFEEGVGTNPEELIAAAHSGCFAMALSLILGEAGFTPDSLEATSAVTVDSAKSQIVSSHL